MIGLTPKPEKRQSTKFIIYLTMALDQRSLPFKTFGLWSPRYTRHLLEESEKEIASFGARLLESVDVLDHFSFLPFEFDSESSIPFRLFVGGLIRSNLGLGNFLNGDASHLQWHSARRMLIEQLQGIDGLLLNVFVTTMIIIKSRSDFRGLEPPEPEPPPSFTLKEELETIVKTWDGSRKYKVQLPFSV